MKITGFLKQVGAGGLAFFVGAHSVLANQPEKNYWDQRRAERSAHRSGTLVSRAVSPSSPAPWGDRFPAVQVFRPSLSPSLERSVPKKFLEKHRALLNALSPVYGTVRKVTLAPRSDMDRVVIHIQDVHHNAEAQSNIRDSVAGLLKSGRVDVVALEGSTETIHLQAFVDFPHRQPVELAADWLLKENKISGPIHAALTFEGQLPRLVGVDDEKHYTANVQAVRDSARQSAGVRRTIEAARRDMEKDKKSVFSPALSTLDKTVNDFRAERIPLGSYVETLSASAGTDKKFPSVELFLRALQMERSLDFKQVEHERKRLIEKLTQTLTPHEIETLMAESAAYRSGGRLFGEFYAGLTALCRRKGVALSAFPAMDEYVRYVLLADGIQSEQLLTEIGLLEKAAYDAVVRTPEERALVDRSRRLWLASRLVDFALTPAEWEEWGKGKGEFDLDSFEAFYREAQARDKAIAVNVGNALADADVAVLVTGGFHAEGVARLLEQRGVSVISFVPKLTKVDLAQGSSYLSVFSQEKTPLEKLFQGEKLFLSTNPIAKEVHRIQLPVVVALLGLLLAAQIDPQLTYALLGGLGQIKDVVAGAGVAQALLVVGAGALVFRVFNKAGKVQVESSPERPGFVTTFKIKFWDPVREQVLYFFPGVILVPSLLTFLVTTTFGGGVVMALVVYLVLGGVGAVAAVVALLELEHDEGYSQSIKDGLKRPALIIAGLTGVGLVVSMLSLSPSAMGLVSSMDQFFSWMPAGEWKAFFLSALAGNLLGVWKHFAHNEKTFGNFLKWRKGESFEGLLPLSATAAGSSLVSKPQFVSYPVRIPENMNNDKEVFLNQTKEWLKRLPSGSTKRFQQVSLFVDVLKELNPQFCDNNPGLMDVHSLTNDLALLKYVINSALFLPLHASAEFSDGSESAYFNFNPESWRGARYLGQEIWWVDFAKNSDPGLSRIDHGFGLISARVHSNVSLHFGRWIQNDLIPSKGFRWQWVEKFKKDLPRHEQAIAMLLEKIIVEYLKGHAFARLSQGPNRMLFAPTIESIASAIVRPGGPLSKMSLSAEMNISSEAQLIALLEVVQDLRKNNRNELAVVLFYYWLGRQLQFVSSSPETAVPLLLQTENINTMDDLLKRIIDKQTAAKIQVDAILKFLQQLHDKSFIPYSERFERIYGTSPPLDQPQLLPIGGLPEVERVVQTKSEPIVSRQEPVVVPKVNPVLPTPRGPLSSVQILLDDIEQNGARYSPLSVIVRLAKAETDSEPVKLTVNSLINQYLPLVLKEMEDLGLGHLGEKSEPGLVSSGLEAILKGMQGISLIKSVPVEETNRGLDSLRKKLRGVLLGFIRDNENPAQKLLDYYRALELEKDSIDFLRKYIEIRNRGTLPTSEAIADGTFESDKEKAVNVRERLVGLLGDGHLLPINEDVQKNPDSELSEGDLAPIYKKGYRVVVFEEHFQKNVAKNSLRKKAIVNVVTTLINQQETALPGQSRIVRDSRDGLNQREIHMIRSSGQIVVVKLVGEKTYVVLWVDSENKAHARKSFEADKEFDGRIVLQHDNLANQLDKYVALGADFFVDETANLSELLLIPQTEGDGGGKANSLLYLRTGRVGVGIVGAGVEAMFLLLSASILGGVGMGFFLLPLFSLAHVWIIARQNPGMSLAQLIRQFVWHYLLALPYALIGVSGVQEILGGENAAQLFAVGWHLLTDIVFMVQDQISARKAARNTMDMLLPPAGPLLIEQVGGARWGQEVRPQLSRRGFARAYEKALARELLIQPKGSFPTGPAGLVGWLESSFTGTPVTEEGQRVYVQAVDSHDLDDVLRSAKIVQGWVDSGLDAPRLVLAAKDAVVLAKLRALARPGVVDVIDKPVAAQGGVLDAVLLLDSLNRFRISPSARLSVMVSATISVPPSALDQLNDSELAQRLREALIALLKGDPIRHHEFRTFLEVASAVLESA
ncbi:MAG: hypothetical protein IPN19_14785 [Elusimicrobia bacterium]|nr:hypothetical protein [Elusimicrobiota bacterium]